jgi:hypothetical protein
MTVSIAVLFIASVPADSPLVWRDARCPLALAASIAREQFARNLSHREAKLMSHVPVAGFDADSVDY